MLYSRFENGMSWSDLQNILFASLILRHRMVRFHIALAKPAICLVVEQAGAVKEEIGWTYICTNILSKAAYNHTMYMVRRHSLRYGYTNRLFGSECPNILHIYPMMDFWYAVHYLSTRCSVMCIYWTRSVALWVVSLIEPISTSHFYTWSESYSDGKGEFVHRPGQNRA